MTDHAINSISALWNALTNKVSGILIASGTVVGAKISDQITPSGYKPLSEIPITDIFVEPQSAGNIIILIGGFSVCLNILNGIGFFRLCKWLWLKLWK